MCARLLKRNMWSYLETSCFFDGLSLTSLSIPLVQPSRPPSSSLSFLFPPIQPFSSCHPWAGGLSLWEVKGHRGWEGSRQVVRAPCSPFPTAHVKCCWTLTPVGPHSQKSVWNAIQPARPYSGPDSPWEEKRIPPIPIVVSALPLSAGQAGSDDRPPLARTRLPKSLFSMWFDPQVPLLTHRDQTLGISGGFRPLKLTLLTKLKMTNDFF